MNKLKIKDETWEKIRKIELIKECICIGSIIVCIFIGIFLDYQVIY